MAADFVVGGITEVVLDPAPEVVLALHACDTATDDALARAVAWESPLVLAAPCCHHDIAAQLRRTPTPAPYALLTRHGILRERFADTLTDAVRASLLRLQGYRVDVMQFVESKHTPRNTLLRAVRTGTPVRVGRLGSSAQGVRRPGRDVGDPAQAGGAASRSAMRERYLLGLTAVPFVVAALLPGSVCPGSAGNEVTRFEDPEIVESSGLAVVDGLLGDHQRLRRLRPGLRRRPRHRRDRRRDRLVGRARRRRGARSGRAAARSGSATSATTAPSARRSRCRACRSDAGTSTSTRRRTSWSIPTARATPSRCSPTRPPAASTWSARESSAGSLYAAPERLSAGKPNRLEEVGPVLGIATDAAFFPDGRHIIVRNYTQAAVYSWPELVEVGRFGLPDQQQGEGIAVADDDTIYASSEGLHAPVLRIALPAAVRRAMEPPPVTLTATPIPTPSDDAAAGHPPGQ